MKTRTNQPVFLDNGQPVNDGALGGSKVYLHTLTIVANVDDDELEYYCMFYSFVDSAITSEYEYRPEMGEQTFLTMPVLENEDGAIMGVSLSDLINGGGMLQDMLEGFIADWTTAGDVTILTITDDFNLM